MSKLESEGFDFSGGLVRVPDGVEVDAIVTDQQELDLIARGAEIVERGQEFKWKGVKAQSFAAALPRPPEPTVRIVRADWFVTKGQGFLYVEARTTQGAQTAPIVGMTLENDQGPGTEFISARTMSRFVDSGVYMFHRNLFKLAKRPDQIRVSSSTGGVATGPVSDWLVAPVTQLTSTPGYQWDFVNDYKTPQQVYAPLRGDRAAVLGHRRDRPAQEQDERLPAQGAGDDRRDRAVSGGHELGRLGP